jgi:outer membrane cobalamin receptor
MRSSFTLGAALLALAAGSARADDAMWGGQVDGGPAGKGTPRKPFEPSTKLELTGEQLAERGASNLGEALDLLPEITVRTSGRGGLIADMHGARKGYIKIIVDGVPIDDPYYGNFDLSSIPVTDIVEVRVSTAPASPIDGPGGPGGVIEVTTLRATGDRQVSARAQGSTSPDASAWVTGRATLLPGFGIRVSGGGVFGGHDFDAAMPDGTQKQIGENTRTGHVALRLERTTDVGTVGLDAWAQHRSYVVPPGDDAGADVSVVDGENMARFSLWGETTQKGWRVLGRGYFHLLSRSSTTFDDASLTNARGFEDVNANRQGLAAYANRPIVGDLELVLSATVDSESADVASGPRSQGGRSTLGEVATGVQLKQGGWHLDAAAGVALPDSVTPWPEARVVAGFAPIPEVEFQLVGARKGRMPTLRERFANIQGNPDLKPENATYVEASVTLEPVAGLSLATIAYARWVENMVKLDPMSGVLNNIGRVNLRGLDVDASYAPVKYMSVLASWHYIDATSPDIGAEPLDFLPHNRLDGGVNLRWPKRAGLTGRVRWIDNQDDQGMTLPTRTSADASAYYLVRPDLRATLRVDNVTDNRYLLRSNGYRDPGRVIMLGVEGTWK